MTELEILAPCGSAQALTAALRCGADAVYFGTGDFNARKNADNFGEEALPAAIEQCRLHKARVHLTLNTLVSDAELKKCMQTIQRTCRLAADALILQDLGVLRLARTVCPDMVLHASTQMSVGTSAGLQLLAERGFSRAVLPRELSKAEIAAIAQTPPLELEAFVHGALCMCVSGQCLLSAVIGTRSGNRGLCAQPCRLPFAAENGTGHDLSLKDLSLMREVQTLAALGVCSLKIEGRMKRPEYVAAAVTACKEAANGAYTDARAQDLQALFSRSGFTNGYFANQRGKGMFGTRNKENVQAATTSLLKTYEKLYEKEAAVRGVDFRFSATLDKLPSLTAECDGHAVTVCGDVVCEAATHKPCTVQVVTEQLQKCGGTVFFTKSTTCEIEENIRLSLSKINAMRRAALEALAQEICAAHPLVVKDYNFTEKTHIAAQPKLYVRFRDVRQVPSDLNAARIFLPLDTPKAVLEQHQAGVYLPRGIFGTEKAVHERLLASGARYALCDTLDAVAIAKRAGVEVVGGSFLNLYNTLALEEAAEIGLCAATLSHELTLPQIAALGGALPRGVWVYGRTPLMLTRNCPVQNGKTCAQCGKKGKLTDRLGIVFPVLCENGFSELFNSRPTYMLDRLREIRNVDFYLLDFTTESQTQCRQVLAALQSGANPEGDYTRGLFYRGVE